MMEINQPPMRRLTWKQIQGSHPKKPTAFQIEREKQKEQARILRAQGMAFEDIAAKLRCGVHFCQGACKEKK